MKYFILAAILLAPTAQAAIHLAASLELHRIEANGVDIDSIVEFRTVAATDFDVVQKQSNVGSVQSDIYTEGVKASARSSDEQLHVSARVLGSNSAVTQSYITYRYVGEDSLPNAVVRIPYTYEMKRDNLNDTAEFRIYSTISSPSVCCDYESILTTFADTELTRSGTGYLTIPFSTATVPIMNYLFIHASVRPVPEPSTYALMALGLLGIPVAKKYRK